MWFVKSGLEMLCKRVLYSIHMIRSSIGLNVTLVLVLSLVIVIGLEIFWIWIIMLADLV